MDRTHEPAVQIRLGRPSVRYARGCADSVHRAGGSIIALISQDLQFQSGRGIRLIGPFLAIATAYASLNRNPKSESAIRPHRTGE